jgi:hypothetical protein
MELLRTQNPYFEEIHAIYESDAKTLLEFKKEMLLKKVYSL